TLKYQSKGRFCLGGYLPEPGVFQRSTATSVYEYAYKL
ncbi:hypothetical protein SASC598O11_001970, partial [Snodgrassella alvi SCGC AB-598-O11]